MSVPMHLPGTLKLPGRFGNNRVTYSGKKSEKCSNSCYLLGPSQLLDWVSGVD